jgi:hypothetical protein
LHGIAIRGRYNVLFDEYVHGSAAGMVQDIHFTSDGPSCPEFVAEQNAGVL